MLQCDKMWTNITELSWEGQPSLETALLPNWWPLVKPCVKSSANLRIVLVKGAGLWVNCGKNETSCILRMFSNTMAQVWWLDLQQIQPMILHDYEMSTLHRGGTPEHRGWQAKRPWQWMRNASVQYMDSGDNLFLFCMHEFMNMRYGQNLWCTERSCKIVSKFTEPLLVLHGLVIIYGMVFGTFLKPLINRFACFCAIRHFGLSFVGYLHERKFGRERISYKLHNRTAYHNFSLSCIEALMLSWLSWAPGLLLEVSYLAGKA